MKKEKTILSLLSLLALSMVWAMPLVTLAVIVLIARSVLLT